MPHSTILDQATESKKTLEERKRVIEERDQHEEARCQAGIQFLQLHSLPIYLLPAEIWLNILSRLGLDDYPALIASLWHVLRHHLIVPRYSSQSLHDLLVEPRRGFFGSIEHAVDPSRTTSHGFLERQFRGLLLSKLAPRPAFFPSFTDVGNRLRGGFEHLPREIRDHVYNLLDIETSINVTLACYRFSDQDIFLLTHIEV
ncbi:hypothetical protein MMC21_008065 [Puttea exsequens]|nr:hypothetical protein [Puttea exsequens]